MRFNLLNKILITRFISVAITGRVFMKRAHTGDINTDARRHRWSLWYRTAFALGDERHQRIQPWLVTLTGCSRHIGPSLMQFSVAVDQAVVPIETLQFHTRWR